LPPPYPCGFTYIKMSKIVVGSPSLTEPLIFYPGLGPAMLEQHRQSCLLHIQKQKRTCKSHYYNLNYNKIDNLGSDEVPIIGKVPCLLCQLRGLKCCKVV
jgi:hypothetical protein